MMDAIEGREFLEEEERQAAAEKAAPRTNGHAGEHDDEQPQRSISRLRITDPTQFQDRPIPPRRWVVPDWIPWGYVTGLYGPGSTGKTLLAQQLMTAAAVNKPWVGLGVAPIRTLAVFCEDDDDELQRRQGDIN